LYGNIPKTLKTESGHWLQISPNFSECYRIFDPVAENESGRILFDKDDNWLYGGEHLSVAEQEEVAGGNNGHQKERKRFFKQSRNIRSIVSSIFCRYYSCVTDQKS
jgi:hypothetical protein